MTEEVLIERLGSEEFAPTEGLLYEDVFELHKLYEKLAFNANLILAGHKGTGKTLSIASYAAKIKCPIVTFDCSEDVRRVQLIGMFIKRGAHTPYILGPIPTAIEIANETGQCILCFEEVNALTPQCQKILNPLTDFRQKVEVPECKKVFRLRAGAKLWVVGTMNFAVYGGVYQLNEDLKSRFRLMSLNYPPFAKEKLIVQRALSGKGVPNVAVIDDALKLAKETRQGSLDYALSPRDVVQLVEDVQLLGAHDALRVLIGKFEADDQATVIKRIESIYGLQLKLKEAA